MTKKKSIVSKLLFLMLLLTLISCCFLGNTFARYTSGGSGSATVTVAKWDITHGAESIAVAFDKLSPDMDEYKGTPRTHSTGLKFVATITNSGDVDANVTLSAAKAEIFLQKAEGTALTYGNGIGDPGGSVPNRAQAEEVFSIKLYYSTTEQASPTDKNTTSYDYTAEKPVTIPIQAGGNSIFVYAEVIWTSDITGSLTGAAADERDTWLGKNAATVNYVVGYTAVQASELPPTA